MKQVTIAGMGPGSAGCMTQEVCRAVKQADVLIGSERLIAPYTDQRTVKAVTAAEILRREIPDFTVERKNWLSS